MATDGVEDIRDFRWESQLRYYWEHHEAPPSGVKPQVRPQQICTLLCADSASVTGLPCCALHKA
jgi:hypothetical protein